MHLFFTLQNSIMYVNKFLPNSFRFVIQLATYCYAMRLFPQLYLIIFCSDELSAKVILILLLHFLYIYFYYLSESNFFIMTFVSLL